MLIISGEAAICRLRSSSRYTSWGSVYQPINFLFMKAIWWSFLGNMQFVDGFAIRDYAPQLQMFIVALHVAVPAWTMLDQSWNGYTVIQKVLFHLCYTLSAPVLFGMERGNVIILCFFVTMTLSDVALRRIIGIAAAKSLRGVQYGGGSDLRGRRLCDETQLEVHVRNTDPQEAVRLLGGVIEEIVADHAAKMEPFLEYSREQRNRYENEIASSNRLNHELSQWKT